MYDLTMDGDLCLMTEEEKCNFNYSMAAKTSDSIDPFSSEASVAIGVIHPSDASTSTPHNNLDCWVYPYSI